ncbi:MAG: VOC family protein [Anaerocolumna sp.]
MKLKNIVFVVENIEVSKSFYKELFGLQVIHDFGENVILMEGLVLQEKKLWETAIAKMTNLGGHNACLYFEENNMADFIDKLNNCNYQIEYVTPCMERDQGQRVVRIYDPDRHVIEVSESVEFVARRLLREGLTVEEVVEKTRMPYSYVEMMNQ